MTINYDTDIEVEFVLDRNSVNSDASFAAFKDKWGKMFPEMVSRDSGLELFLLLRDNTSKQNDYLQDQYRVYFDLLVPATLLKMVLLANQYGVTTGVVYLQMKGDR